MPRCRIFYRQLLQSVNLKLWINIFTTVLMLFSASVVYAEGLVRFDINKQRADQALIEFALKANTTIIFSFELTKNYQANELKGYHSANSGLIKLLKGSGLTSTLNASGQLSIHIDPNYNTNTEDLVSTEREPKVKVTSVIQQDTTELNTQPIEKISIVGSRVSGRSVDDIPVPVDIFSSEALLNTGQTEVGRMLQTIAPSFNFPSSSISDGTDALRPASLRGLGPDQTLVLINGKRRHQASLIHINSTVGRGTAGTDMNAIPAASIKRIEVLRDGASAQYGSDAIAGVINIVLKDNNEGGRMSASYGEHSAGDGETTNIDLSKGFSLGKSGYVSTTLNFRDRAYTNRAGLHGSCQYTGCSELSNGTFLLGDPREISAQRNTFRIGDADSQQLGMTINSAYQFDNSELYGFVTYSNRDNESAAFFRHNIDVDGNAPLQDGDATIPEGFLPKINSEIKDISYNVGYQINFESGAAVDLSYTYGQNNIDYITSDTINSSFANALQYNADGSLADILPNDIRQSIPREAYAYGLELGLSTLNLDFKQDFSIFSLALGAEIRTDYYKVTPGDEYSYKDYDSFFGTDLLPTDRSAGTQGFGGIEPTSKVDETRHVISLYADTEVEVTEDFIVSGAARYDQYDGFGASTNFKLAANWSLNESIAFRGALSTGFKAPSMQQLYFNNISTQFITPENSSHNDQIAVQVGTFRNDSILAQAIGIPELKEEEATNLSLGTIIKLSDSIHVTIDWYSIDIDDRIVISNKLGSGLSDALDTALITSGAGAGQFFLNGADTETQGIDITATWHTSMLTGELDLTFAANFTETNVVRIFSPEDSGLGDIPPEIIFSEQDISIIEEWQPKDRVSLNGLYKIGNFTINLAVNRYGEYTITDGNKQTYGAEVLTDLRLSYQVTDSLSFNIGSNNLFDVYPDKTEIGHSRAGTIVDASGNIIVDSDGVFTYSRRSAPFGSNGSFYYAGAEYTF